MIPDDLYVSERAANRYMFLGIFVALTGLVSCAISGGIGGAPVGTGILLTIIGRTLRSAPLIAIRDDHLEIKPAPLAGKSFVALKDIRGVSRVQKNVLGIEIDGPRGIELKRIGISQVEPGAIEDFVAWLEKQIAARGRTAAP